MKCGFALLEAGSVTKLQALPIVVKNFIDGSIGMVVYWAIGWAMAFGDLDGANPFCGNGYYFFTNLPQARYVEVFFQYCFAAAACTIMSGAIAERMSFQGYAIYAVLSQFWVQPIIAHWTWSTVGWLGAFAPADRLLFGVGMLDFAGGGVVHIAGGAAGLAGILWVGYRNQFVDVQTRLASPNPELVAPRYEQLPDGTWKGNTLPANKPIYAAVGVFILWFGWYGFNGGSFVFLVAPGIPLDSTTFVTALISKSPGFGRAILCTTLAPSSAGIVCLTLGRFLNRNEMYFKWDLNDLLNGLLAGLVAITPAAGYVQVWASFIIGIISAFVYKGVSLVMASPKFRLDDPVDAVAVHFGCGFAGLLLTGLFADPVLVGEVAATNPVGGAFYGEGRRFAAAIIGAIVVTIWTFAHNFALFALFYFIDRNRGRNALFLIRGAPTAGLKAGGSQFQEEEDRMAAPHITGFVDPLGAHDGSDDGKRDPEVVEL